MSVFHRIETADLNLLEAKEIDANSLLVFENATELKLVLSKKDADRVVDVFAGQDVQLSTTEYETSERVVLTWQ